MLAALTANKIMHLRTAFMVQHRVEGRKKYTGEELPTAFGSLFVNLCNHKP